jgi:hypothetical protein
MSASKSNESIEENIRVYIRQRPYADNEMTECGTDNVELSENGSCSFLQQSALGPKRDQFKFNGGFLPSASQHDVYETAAKPIIDSALLGYSGTIFAYGPTNSGKTHTMRGISGNDNNKGIMERCIDDLLTSSRSSKVELWASYIQIYCEMVTDLLDVNGDTGTCGDKESGYLNSGAGNLSIREKEGKVFIEGLKRIPLRNKQDFNDILSYGDQNKIIAETNMNATSSRSHTALMINIMIPDEDDSKTNTTNNGQMGKAYKESTLFLVDLAGSERATASAGKQLKRLEEGKAINLSLSSLGNCMNALAEKRKHIPYRDSKLTRLLQGSLGGGARTSVIVTLPPGDEDSDKLIINVLRFASRAITVKVAAKVSRFIDYESLYQEAISKLDEYEDKKNATIINITNNEDLQDEVMRQKEYINELKKQNDSLKEQLDSAIANTNGSGNKSNSSDNNNDHSGGGYDPSFARPSAKSKDPVDIERYWRDEITKVKDKTNLDIKEIRNKFESQIRILNKTLDEGSREIQILTNDLNDERTKHLTTVGQAKTYQKRLMSCEEELQGRISELLSDRNDLFELLNDEKEKNNNNQLKVNEQQNNINDMIPKSQFDELATLFSDTVEKLSNRVIDLEQGQSQSQPQSSGSQGQGANENSYGSNRGSRSGGSMGQQQGKSSVNNKYGLNLGVSGNAGGSHRQDRIQPGGRIAPSGMRGQAPAARGGSRW